MHMNKDYPNLIAAFESCDWKPPVFEYRAYYDNKGTITLKTTDDLPGNYVVVTQELYSILIYSQWHVVNGQVEPIPVVEPARCMLQSDAEGRYRTLPGNAIFLVNDDYAGQTDNWTI